MVGILTESKVSRPRKHKSVDATSLQLKEVTGIGFVNENRRVGTGIRLDTARTNLHKAVG